MWVKQVLLGVTGLCSGFAVACGIFALIIALGVLSDLADETHTAKHILLYEDAVAAGGILGNIFSMYGPSLAIGNWILAIFGIFAGVFVGAWAMALTEILNVIPIFTRRIGLRRGLELVIVSMALGRSVGAFLFYFWRF